MSLRRKGFSASQSKDTSHRLRTATIGTHLPRVTKHMNADGVGFSSARKKKRASRGIVDNVLTSQSGATSSSRRVQNRRYSQGVKRRVLTRSIVVIALCVVIVGCFGVFAASTAFYASLDSKLELSDSNAAEVLASPQKDAPFYNLVSVDLRRSSSSGTAGESAANTQALALVRLDEAKKTISVLMLPANMKATLPDGSSDLLANIAHSKDDATLIKTINNLTGVSVNHLIKTDGARVVKLVDSLGGLELNLAQEVDDPIAGNTYLSAGTQTLLGEDVLTVLRANNYKEGIDVQAENQFNVLMKLSERLVGADGLDCLLTLDKVGGTFQTDVNAHGAEALAQAFRGFDPADVQHALVPGYEKERDKVNVFFPLSDSWTAMKEAFAAGSTLKKEEQAETVDPSSFTVTVRNGGGITGAASTISDLLKSEGFDVTNEGNTDMQVYNETLVVYQDDSQKAAAETVVQTLGMGRTVQDSIHYKFSTDVLLVLGKDFKPTA